MNSELKKELRNGCNIKKLSMNPNKANYMTVISQMKKIMNVKINISNRDGSCLSLEQNNHIKYLGVMIDSSLT